eukprot:TRINITY_DN8967_c0_g1_i1.p1 TRINITY_DN8967_c0_g1~~TRINITY_DN8967_c0_g1_i1.p1  ORF type:complete len:187 (-),score=15.69 TRINITY_DN8967_c0_g1_i1:529-1089(-)
MLRVIAYSRSEPLAVPRICAVCLADLVDYWICLNCLESFCGSDHEGHVLTHSKAKVVGEIDPHCVFINPLRALIYCFICDCEIHDHELYPKYYVDEQLFKGSLSPIKARYALDLHFDSFLLKPQPRTKAHAMSNKGMTLILDYGNSGTLKSLLYIISQITCFRKIAKKVFCALNERNNLPPKYQKR